jgi:putative membrane protein
MIRFIRTVLLAAMATVLLIVAFANLEIVTVRFLPSPIGAALGMDRTFQVPLFLVILLAMLSGIALGFVWEWRREAKHRSAATQHRREAARLEREVSRLRQSADEDQDEVLALLEAADRPR